MTSRVDRGFAILLGLFGLLHAYGSFAAYAFPTPELVWALSATVLCLLVATLNFVRAGRPADTTLAWITLVASLLWVVLALAFGVSEGNILDPRALLHASAAAVLAGFSVRTIAASPALVGSTA